MCKLWRNNVELHKNAELLPLGGGQTEEKSSWVAWKVAEGREAKAEELAQAAHAGLVCVETIVSKKHFQFSYG